MNSRIKSNLKRLVFAPYDHAQVKEILLNRLGALELEIFGSINNLFNRQYASFGILDRNAFSGPSRSFNGSFNGSFDNANAAGEQFRGYGAPRGAWVGLRLSWL